LKDLSAYAVIVPSLHPDSDHFLPFIQDLVRLSPGAVVVVDDGSGEDYRSTFRQAEDLGCLVITSPVNRGKGRALKTAMQHCAEELGHLSGVITADSDGQHTAADIAKVAARLDELDARGVEAAVLGSRSFDGPGVPARSRIGNTATTKIVRALFGSYVADTQTGLRGFPLELAKRAAHVRGEKFDYEMNQLIWLLTTRHRVEEVPIRTIYHDASNSISHFRPVRDSLWIYFIIVRQFLTFVGVSAASAVVDLVAYYILIDFVFGADRSTSQVALAVALARVLSALFNFTLNRTVVFRDSSGPARALRRYYLLAVIVMVSSSAGTAALSVLSGGHDMWAKIVCDATLFCVSYAAQQRWVFAGNRPDRRAIRAVVPARRR
jgi:dolichol-phosphate mannosyltransferase